MPLKAVIENATIIAPELTDAEWEDLKARHRNGLPVTMACCGAPGHLRASKRGTRHFYHAVDAGCASEHESTEHLEIKYRIYRACRAEGWDAGVEHPSPDRSWISDVCAMKGDRTVVFEIQLSPIPSPDLASRDRKYRNAGIESYWLLDRYFDRSAGFEADYHAFVYGDGRPAGRPGPYIDPSFLSTGTENHIFIAKGIRTVGLNAKKRALFTTNNPEIPLDVWVREVLNGNYPRYLDESATTISRKRRLIKRAAPSLARLRDVYYAIVRDRTYEKKLADCRRQARMNDRARNDPALQQKFHTIEEEIGWLKREYSAVVSDNSGLFSWKRLPQHATPRPFFRPEPEANIQKLEDCIRTFTQWEASFTAAIDALDREMAARPG